jgi:hypothetical protein
MLSGKQVHIMSQQGQGGMGLTDRLLKEIQLEIYRVLFEIFEKGYNQEQSRRGAARAANLLCCRAEVLVHEGSLAVEVERIACCDPVLSPIGSVDADVATHIYEGIAKLIPGSSITILTRDRCEQEELNEIGFLQRRFEAEGRTVSVCRLSQIDSIQSGAVILRCKINTRNRAMKPFLEKHKDALTIHPNPYFVEACEERHLEIHCKECERQRDLSRGLQGQLHRYSFIVCLMDPL